MHIKHIHQMIERLSECAKMELEKGIENVDTKEMAEVAEMIKELSEAEYYAKISKAMDESEYGEDYDEMGLMDDGRRGYRGQPRSQSGRFMKRGDGRRRGYEEPMYFMGPEMHYSPEHWRDMDREAMGRMYYSGDTSGSSGAGEMGSRNYGGESGGNPRNYGGSGGGRMGYEEPKKEEGNNDSRKKKMEELEKFMRDLSEDITGAISQMDGNEKATIKNKLQALAQKVQ